MFAEARVPFGKNYIQEMFSKFIATCPISQHFVFFFYLLVREQSARLNCFDLPSWSVVWVQRITAGVMRPEPFFSRSALLYAVLFFSFFLFFFTLPRSSDKINWLWFDVTCVRDYWNPVLIRLSL